MESKLFIHVFLVEKLNKIYIEKIIIQNNEIDKVVPEISPC
jgi:hypothetical protein